MTNSKAIEEPKWDLKPRVGNYAKAAYHLTNATGWENLTAEEMSREYPDEFKKYLFLEVKTCGKLNVDEADAEDVFTLFSSIVQMFRYITPHDLLHMFPPEKTYDGRKCQTKDYFTTMAAIQTLNLDKPIGDDDTVLRLLFDYQNWDINYFMVNWMTAVSRMNQACGGRGLVEEFLFGG